MAQVSRSTKVGGSTTLSANTTARATDVETDMLTLFNAHNNHDTGTSKWTVVSAEGMTTVPLTVNNSTGTQNIAEFKDNGTAVVTIADGGNVTLTGKVLGPDGTKTVPTYSFSGDADCGLYRIGTNNIGLSVNDTKIVDVATTGVTITGKATISGGVVGTATNDSATAGNVGEYVEATAGLTSISSSNTGQDLTSIALTAGDWDVSGGVIFTQNGATWTQQLVYVANGVSGNSFSGSTTGITTGQAENASSSTTPTKVYITVPSVRVSLAGSATIYLKVRAIFSAGTPQAEGGIHARRVR